MGADVGGSAVAPPNDCQGMAHSVEVLGHNGAFHQLRSAVQAFQAFQAFQALRAFQAARTVRTIRSRPEIAERDPSGSDLTIFLFFPLFIFSIERSQVST